MEFFSPKATTSGDAELIAQLTNITIIISRYGILALVILGTIGNTLNLIVFSQRKLQVSPCTLYLFTSACIDLVLTLGIALPRALNTYNLDYSASIGILCKIRHFTYFTLSSLSVWMVALATVDRFLISSPMITRRQMSSFRNAYRLIAASSIILALVFGDLFYCADVVNTGVIASCSSSTSKQCGFYNQIARLLTVLCIPEIVIIMFSIGISKNLKTLKVVRASRLQGEAKQHGIRKTDRELIKLVIAQSVMLTISWVPLGIQRIYALITYDVVKSSLRKTIEGLSDELTSAISRCDHSLSFYVYLLTGSIIFRQALAKWFRTITRRNIIEPVSGTTAFHRVTTV